MTLALLEPLKQRAEYTHKFNSRTGRHGWLRLTPAYSVKIVEELIGQYDYPMRVLDPFCGTGTTALSAAYHGHESVTTDINPFLIWLGNAKTAYYSPAVIASAEKAATRVIRLVTRNEAESVPPPPIHNIERWWSQSALSFLCQIHGAIDATTKINSAERTLLLIAFCRTLIELSNATFNHQSMSFKEAQSSPSKPLENGNEIFRNNLTFVLSGAAENPSGSASVVLGDSRNLRSSIDGKFDLVITSPPYANRMSYIRELRPYMYWLGFLINGRDAGELDWTAIGGTWGIATSRLQDWSAVVTNYIPAYLHEILDKISHSDNANGQLLASYIAKYSEDMWKHFYSIKEVLSTSARLHYIVGNSTFYGVLLPTERIYYDMLNELGFKDVNIRPIRKRNSKKELVEFDVSATWPG